MPVGMVNTVIGFFFSAFLLETAFVSDGVRGSLTRTQLSFSRAD